MNGLSNIDKEAIRTYKESNWGGSCYGMSVTVILAKMGILKPSDIQSGKSTIYEILKFNNGRVESLLNFYQLQVALSNFSFIQSKFMMLNSKEQLNIIERMSEEVEKGGFPFLLSVNGPRAHAVVGYGVERGLYNVSLGEENIETYDSRILIYDCIYPDETRYLYFNKGTDQWHFDDYNRIQLATNDLEILDYKNYNHDVENYIAHLLLEQDTEAYLEYKGEKYLIDGNTDEREIGLVSFYTPSGYLDENGNIVYNGDVNCILPDLTSDYKLIPANNEPFSFTLTYSNTAITAEAQDAKSVNFSPDGTLQVEESEGDYSYSLCFNEGYHDLPWYKFSITGSNSGNMVMEQTDDGIHIKSENLDDAMITVRNDTEEQTLSLSTKETEVLLSKKIVENKEIPVILIDTNHDGIFDEEASNSTEYKIILDANGGSVSPSILETVDGKLDNLPIPTKDGYNFEGWYTAIENGEKIDSNYIFTEDTTLYAIWKPQTPEIIPVTDITLENQELSLIEGETAQLSAEISPENATNKSILWSSSDSTVASVDENGLVTAVSVGTATITATSSADNSIKDSCVITVDAKQVEPEDPGENPDNPDDGKDNPDDEENPGGSIDNPDDNPDVPDSGKDEPDNEENPGGTTNPPDDSESSGGNSGGSSGSSGGSSGDSHSSGGSGGHGGTPINVGGSEPETPSDPSTNGNTGSDAQTAWDGVSVGPTGGALLLDTKTYTMAPGDLYDIKMTLVGASVLDMKIYSSRSGIASVQPVGDGKYRVTGLSDGVTYIMFEVYRNGIMVNHASVKVTVENGAIAHGESNRAASLF